MAPEPQRVLIGLASPRRFDGVICFGGGDWWYHNRGHYDMQMVRRLHRKVPVLWVNSLGIRVPRLGEGAMFLRRVLRKLASIRRGFSVVEPGFAVLTPFVIPGRRGMALSKPFLAPQIRAAARRLGIERPLVWVTCPPGVEALPGLRAAAVVYQRTDRWEAYPEADPELIRGYHRRLREAADVTLYCARLLFDEEGAGTPDGVYVDHGVDFERFAAAGRAPVDPPDVAPIPRPRIGFVGGIDASTFDPALLVDVARRLPECQLVLVGGCSLPPGWADLPNVHLLGQKDYDEVPQYMAACDVLIMPWNQSEWIQACNPVKLKEYLAVGRPIVSTPFPELARYEGYVRRAATGESFAAAVREALAGGGDAEGQRARVREETWDAKAECVLAELAARGVRPDEPDQRSGFGTPSSARAIR